MKRRDVREIEAGGLSVAEEAAGWLVTLKDPGVSRTDKQSFVTWLRRSPVHIEEFLRISTLDAALSRDLGFDPEALLADCDDTVPIRGFRSSGPAMHRKAGSKALFTIAASLLVLTATAILVTTRGSSAYTTQRGEQRSVSLADGSLMELNTDSEVRVAYGKDLRQIRLVRGEALFSVAKDSARPFVVDAGMHSVRATGTRFSVAERAERIVVTVMEGSVAVSSVDSSTRTPRRVLDLVAGQQLLASDAPEPQVRSVDPHRALAWQEWKLYFDDDSLADVVGEFNRYNRRQLKIADDALGHRRISGVFFANQPDSLLAFIADRDAIVVSEQRDGTRVIQLK
jgi:transmembrane sensor